MGVLGTETLHFFKFLILVLGLFTHFKKNDVSSAHCGLHLFLIVRWSGAVRFSIFSKKKSPQRKNNDGGGIADKQINTVVAFLGAMKMEEE